MVKYKLKVIVSQSQFFVSSSWFLVFSVLSFSLQVPVLLLRWFVSLLFLCIRYKFFLIFYLHIICKMSKFTCDLLSRRIPNSRTIIDGEGVLMLSYLSVSLLWCVAVLVIASISCVSEPIVLPSLPFFVNDLFFILVSRRFITPIKMGVGC